MADTEKRIELFSMSEHRISQGSVPPVPDSTTLQHQFDVRVIADPVEYYGTPGTDPVVQKFVMDQAVTTVLLSQFKLLIRLYLDLLKQSEEFSVLRICFICGGGFQRSVAVTEAVAEWLKTQPYGFPVTIRHLRLEEDAQKK